VNAFGRHALGSACLLTLVFGLAMTCALDMPTSLGHEAGLALAGAGACCELANDRESRLNQRF